MEPATEDAHLPHSFRVTSNISPNMYPTLIEKDCILFYHPSCKELAEKTAAASKSIELGAIDWSVFNDGFPNVFVRDALDIRNRHVAFLCSFHEPSVIFEQISVIYALPRLFISSFTLVLPFFPTGTLERVEAEGEVATAFTLARMLSNIPLTRGGPASIVIFDIHALQERFYFGDAVLPLFESGVPLLLQRLAVQWLVEWGIAIGGHPKQCQKLLDQLSDEALLRAAHALDQLTDLPEFACHRPKYRALCDTLQEAEVLLLHVQSRSQRLWQRVFYSSRPKELRSSLQEVCDLDTALQLYPTLQSRAASVPTAPRITFGRLPSMQPHRGPSSELPQCSEPALPPHVFQHCDDPVPLIDEQLKDNRNIGIVGAGGIGKTTIARAVFERARSRFDDAVWLTVGKDAYEGEILRLLVAAFVKLYPRKDVPFATAAEGLQALARLTHGGDERGRAVLLVLDDLWPWMQGSPLQLAALNFATQPSLRHDGSRLIVTTRSEETLSFLPRDPIIGDVTRIHKPGLRVLKEGPAKQLLYHHAFGSADADPPEYVPAAACSELLQSCGGNPLALEVLGGALRHCRTAEAWEEHLKVQKSQRAAGAGDDAVMQTCATSVEILPPSLKECFMDFAMFPEDARVGEEALLHLFATHAPLHTPASVKAAAAKLEQLVSRSLVSRAVAPDSVTMCHHHTHEYYMHDILRDIALRLSMEDQERCISGSAHSHASSMLRYISSHQAAGHVADASIDPKLKVDGRRLLACVVIDGARSHWDKRWRHLCAPRLQWLWLEFQGCAEETAVQYRCCWPMLRFLRMRLDHVLASEVRMEGLGKLEHLDLSGSESLEKLPEGISGCSQLQHLNLRGCKSLTQLPEGISGCSQLQHLDLSQCESLTHLPEGISGCSQLQHLDLSGCMSLAAVPEGIKVQWSGHF